VARASSDDVIVLGQRRRARLEAIVARETAPQRLVRHAKIVLAAWRGEDNATIARDLPIREEVVMAAEESAQFHRWSVTTNVDDDVLDQMTADVAELARREQIDPPAASFSRLLGARDDVFTP
jgi:predicted NACHT family NTPase